jgi:hypothetical protein
MRILIYSDNLELCEKLRSEGHHASLRNPQFFSESEIEKCDAFVSDDERIVKAHKAAKIPTFGATHDAPKPKPASKKRK